MFDNKEVKQITHLLDKFEVQQGSQEDYASILIRNKKEIYNKLRQDYEGLTNIINFKSKISKLSTKKVKLKDLEEPRELDITLLMAQRPAFVLSYIKKSLKEGLQINSIDKKLDETLLMYTARTNNMNICKLLISKLANIDIKNVKFS